MKKIIKQILLGLGLIATVEHGLGVMLILCYFGLFDIN